MEQQVTATARKSRTRRKPATKETRGRKPKWTDFHKDLILEEISTGRSLNKICQQDDMPGTSTVMEWLSENQEFSAKYARAREIGADTLFDKILELQEDINPANAHAQRAKIDAIKWVIGKMKPREYSDKIIHAGHDGGPLTLSWKAETDQDVIDITPALAIPEN